MTLDDLQIGQQATIVTLAMLAPDIRKKLMVMGMLPNTTVSLIRRAPLGDPLQVEVRGVTLALRGKIAQAIEVEAK